MDAKAIVLVAPLDDGMPQAEHFRIEESQVNQELQVDDLLVRLLVISPDPFLRGSIKSTGSNRGGQVMMGYVAGKVLASKNSNWVEGDLFGAYLPFKTVQVVSAQLLAATQMWKLTGKIDESKISLGVGILGMPGSTAYGGLLDILRPHRGETIFISAASGAVGALVGRLAKHLFSCKVIGSCGSEEKCQLAKDNFGFDHCINYKNANTAADLVAMLKTVAPEGIDMYFENVGGIHFDAAMEVLRPHGRVAVCGVISEYNKGGPPSLSINPGKMIYQFQRVEGFTCGPWLSGAKGNFHQDMADFYNDDVFKVQESVFEGIEQWAEAFQSLFTGKNVGKVVLRV